MLGLVVVLVVLVLATAVGLWRRRTDGRLRAGSSSERVDLAALGLRGGEQVTFLQFSSAVCSGCRSARGTLGAVAVEREGVSHLEVDAEEHLELATTLGIRRTPTTLVLDPAGQVLGRLVGPPRRAEVLAALESL